MKVIDKKTTRKNHPSISATDFGDAEQITTKSDLSQPESENNNEQLGDDEYNYHQLSRPLRIIFARFLDLILSSIIPLVLSLTMRQWNPNHNVWAPIVAIIATFIIFFFYFVIIPYVWTGKTLGKWLMRITLVTTNNKLRMNVIFTRELFIIFIPWFVELIFNFVFDVIFKVNLGEILAGRSETSQIASIVMKIVTTFYFLWYLGLVFGVYLNKNHQILFDKHFNLFIVKIKPNQVKKPKKKREAITRNKEHVHLKRDQPGNISDEALKEIEDL
ncbi:hypothetical protein P344_01850 [Spiroplasma mirum ATCC 29335]|uniref:RDD domain-containing protein n=1 Tax=Spiroplasma mirum ATCC 29335 TaxID=838561 RepID=W0GNW7_9MOLU|nr:MULTISPECIES: RDD family protein [Spiroplasma]AHF60758.1 hypothetical protein SMM_0307 [Spiroplasma mirum ATCC 29335]AHI57718.1 hypothetical protein P344_01850 [Spiroplasma mirum ATCC 29335]AKM52877.1 hypothetical protein SATRI_v1c03500 [Spiroplasma atrichopogonis]